MTVGSGVAVAGNGVAVGGFVVGVGEVVERACVWVGRGGSGLGDSAIGDVGVEKGDGSVWARASGLCSSGGLRKARPNATHNINSSTR